MKLFYVVNGDCSAKITVFAESEKEAKQIARKEIRETDMKHLFPVLETFEHEIKKGVVDVWTFESEF